MSGLKVRQMCGGGTWRRSDWKPRRSASGDAVILDAIGIAIVKADPHDDSWGPFTWRWNHRLRDRLYDRFGDPRCWWPRGHQPITEITGIRLPEPGVAILEGLAGWSQRVEVTERHQVCRRCRAVLG